MITKSKIKFSGKSLAIFSAILIASVTTAGAQPWITPDILWQHNYGGSALDVAKEIHQTSDGGFIMVGNTNSSDIDVTVNYGQTDVWVIKTDSLGTIEWQKSYGGSAIDSGETIHQTLDGGYIVGAITYSNDSDVTGNHGNSDFWIFKIDTAGTIQWSKVYGGTGTDDLGAVKQTLDSGYIVVGTTNSNDFDVHGNHGLNDYWFLRLNQSGDTIKTKCYGGTGDDHGSDILQSVGGDFAMAGYSNSSDGDLTGNFGGYDYWILKIDNPTDTVIWQINLGGTYDEFAYGMIQNVAQGYLIVGGSNSNDSGLVSSHTGDPGPLGNFDLWVVKLTNFGTKDWENSIGGFEDEFGYNVIQGSIDSSYTIACKSHSPKLHTVPTIGKTDLYVVEINRFGNLDFGRVFGGSEDDFGYGIDLLPNEELILAGGSYSNDSNLTANNGSCDVWALRLSKAINLSVHENTIYQNDMIKVYPNPFNSTANLVINTENLKGKKNLLNIYNAQGEVVYSVETGKTSTVTLDKNLFTSGLFYYQLVSDNVIVATGKLIAQ